jgi:hypothetical protein
MVEHDVGLLLRLVGQRQGRLIELVAKALSTRSTSFWSMRMTP